MRKTRFIPAITALALAACDTSDRLGPEPGGLLTRPAHPSETVVASDLLGGGSGPNLGIQSDQLGTYVNGVGSVKSIIQSLGDWELDVTAKASTRKVRLDLSNPLPGNPSPAPFTATLVQARFIAKASQLATGGLLQMRGLGATALTPVSVSFTYGGKNYAIRMNSANHPQTDWAVATCEAIENPNDPAGSLCSRWRVTPTGSHDGISTNVGRLELVTTKAQTLIGHYYLSFDFLVTK